MEIWKDIQGYKGYYQVSNLGNVRSMNSNNRRNLVFWKNNKGYLWVDLSVNNKKRHYAVHRLVANTFLENKNNFPCVNHKNEIKTDNNVENLEWCTYKYNLLYGNNSPIYRHKKLYSKKVICIETGQVFENAKEASNNNESLRRHICDVCNGKRKTADGFHWKYFK